MIGGQGMAVPSHWFLQGIDHRSDWDEMRNLFSRRQFCKELREVWQVSSVAEIDRGEVGRGEFRAKTAGNESFTTPHAPMSDNVTRPRPGGERPAMITKERIGQLTAIVWKDSWWKEVARA